METKFNGNYGLFIVRRVTKRRDFFEISFINDERVFFGLQS